MLTKDQISFAASKGFVGCLIFDNSVANPQHNSKRFPHLRDGIIYNFFFDNEREEIRKLSAKLSSMGIVTTLEMFHL